MDHQFDKFRSARIFFHFFEHRNDLLQRKQIDNLADPHKRNSLLVVAPYCALGEMSPLFNIQVVGNGGQVIVYIEISNLSCIAGIAQSPAAFNLIFAPM